MGRLGGCVQVALWLSCAQLCLVGQASVFVAGKQVYDLRVSVDMVSPDGGDPRMGVLINGQFGGPLLRVRQQETIQVTVHNIVDPKLDNSASGISVHWHGLKMNNFPYFDGVPYLDQCPIPFDSNMTYKFMTSKDDDPGPYFYHDHAFVLIADGLSGPLLVEPRGDVDEYYRKITGGEIDDVVVVPLSEWFSKDGKTLAEGLNLPSQKFQWVGTPRSLLMGYTGCAVDCRLKMPGNSSSPQVCNPDPACSSRFVMIVKPNSRYLIHFVGAGSLLYQTVCISGHTLTIVSLDARSIKPVKVGECVDVNLGQRVTVVLETKKDVKVPASYWFTSRAQYRPNMPAAYGVLRYQSASVALEEPAIVPGGMVVPLPTTPAPSPSDPPTTWIANGLISTFVSPGHETISKATVKATIEVSQPITNQTNQIRWALSNVVYLEQPRCEPWLLLAKSNPLYFDPSSNANIIDTAEEVVNLNASNLPGVGNNSSTEAYIFLNLPYNPESMPPVAMSGFPLLETSYGDVVDVLIQNHGKTPFGGIDYPSGVEEHPMHLHGHDFWLLGTGSGRFEDLENKDALLNLENPIKIDTATLPPDGWVYLRFTADNPGFWPLHCHIIWHQYMGQLVVFKEATDRLPPAPAGGVLPQCPTECFMG